MKLKSAFLLLMLCLIPAAVRGQVPSASGTLIFDDEFNGNALNTTAWTVIDRHGEFTQAELECNLPSQVAVTGGSLVITAASAPNPATNICGDSLYAPVSAPYVSGDIQTNTFNFSYGVIEYRAAFPAADEGTWPAVWLLGANCQASNVLTGETGVGTCPSISTTGYQEADLTECFPTHYCGFGVFNPGQECYLNTEPLSDTNYHIYDTVWTPTEIDQYMDGTQVAACVQSMPGPMFPIIQIQIATGMGTPPANLSTTLSVDYIRIFANQYTTSNGTAPVNPTLVSQVITVTNAVPPTLVNVTATMSDGTTPNVTGQSSLFVQAPAPPKLSIFPASFPSGTVGVAYSGSVSASGGTPPYTFSATGLEASLSISTSGSSGLVTGTPTVAETDSGTVTVTDSSSPKQTQSEAYSFVIAAAPPPPLTISPASFPSGTVGVAYSGSVSASGGTPPYTFSATGLEASLSISTSGSSGLVTGTPTVAETDSGTVTVTDSSSPKQTQSEAYSFVIAAAPKTGGPISVNVVALPNATLKTAYTPFQLTATGGNGSYTWLLQQGSLPAGMSLSKAGVLSGTPTAYASGGASGLAIPFYVYCGDTAGDKPEQNVQFELTVN